MNTNDIKKTFSIINDSGEGESRFILEEDQDGLLYETSNAATRELVCSEMFSGWGSDYLRSQEWLDALTDQFGGDRSVAQRYVEAALDHDK